MMLVLAAFFGLLAFLLHSVVDQDLYVPGIAMALMLLTGLMARHAGPLRERVCVLRSRGVVIGAAAMLVIITGLVATFVLSPMVGEAKYFGAVKVLRTPTLGGPGGRERAAIERMERALWWDPLNHQYMSFVASIHKGRGIRTKDPGELREADTWYTRALALHPHAYAFRFRRAETRLMRMQLEDNVDWNAVLGEIERAIEDFPTSPTMHLLYALHLDEAGRPEKAKEQFHIAERYDEGFSRTLGTKKGQANYGAIVERLHASTAPDPKRHE